MSNDKVQISNEVQNTNEQKAFDVRSFGIDLTFGF